jgi:hypothetical protein
MDIRQYFIVSLSLTISLFSPERVHKVKKEFLIKQGVEPTSDGTNYRAKAPRFSHLDCGVIEQKSWLESPLYRFYMVFRENNCKVMTKIRTLDLWHTCPLCYSLGNSANVFPKSSNILSKKLHKQQQQQSNH